MNGALATDTPVMSIAPDQVRVPNRIGFLHEDKAVALGRLIAVDGQRDPIKVVRTQDDPDGYVWKLVVGMHRLRGCQIEGIDVLALEVCGDEDRLVDLEASENLHRRPLGPIERAKFTAALVQAAQERIAREHGNLSQQQLGAKARWQRVKDGEETPEKAVADEAEDAADKMSAAYGWQQSVAEALDMSDRNIRRDLSLYRLLIEPFPDLIEELAKHPTVGENASQLKAIAQVRDEGNRRKVIETLFENSHMNVEMARIHVGVDTQRGPEATRTKAAKFTSTISDSWTRLSLNDQREYLPRFVTMLTDGQKNQLRELLGEEED